MKVEGSDLIFSSGRSLYAHGGIVGMTSTDEPEISGGWDNGIGTAAEAMRIEKLSPEDLIELADFMIARWQAFRDAVRTGAGQ